MHGLGHGKELWLSHGFMFGRLAVGLDAAVLARIPAGPGGPVPDLHEVQGRGAPADAAAVRALDPGLRCLVRRAGHGTKPTSRVLAPLYVVTYAMVVHAWWRSTPIMALQPHWFSNLFGGWYFMGSFLGAHTLLALLMLYGRHQVGIADFISPKQRHDLGKLCFGFTVFWTYLMWSQFLVIWYGNLPEETGFVFARLWGEWRPIGVAVFLGMFVIPFIGLLGVAPKKTPFDPGPVHGHQPLRPLARAVPAGPALGDQGGRPGVRRCRSSGPTALVPRPVPALLRRLCPDLSRWCRLGWPRSRSIASGVTATPRPLGEPAEVAMRRRTRSDRRDDPVIGRVGSLCPPLKSLPSRLA